jgi:hypothetical protein
VGSEARPWEPGPWLSNSCGCGRHTATTVVAPA